MNNDSLAIRERKRLYLIIGVLAVALIGLLISIWSRGTTIEKLIKQIDASTAVLFNSEYPKSKMLVIDTEGNKATELKSCEEREKTGDPCRYKVEIVKDSYGNVVREKIEGQERMKLKVTEIINGKEQEVDPSRILANEEFLKLEIKGTQTTLYCRFWCPSGCCGYQH